MAFAKGFAKKRWDKSRQLQKLHEEKTGEKISLREFYKNDNPIQREVFKYEVSFEMNYAGDSYEFFIPQESMTLYSHGAITNEDEIRSRVKEAVGFQFRGNSRKWVSENVEVNPRGFEKVPLNHNEIDVNRFLQKPQYFDNIPKFEVGKGSSKAKANKNKYNLDIWL